MVFALAACLAPTAAHGQERDPFQPVFIPGEDAGLPEGSSVEIPVVQPDPDEPLPSTGRDAASFFGVAYLLIALGVAALVVARVNSRPLVPDRMR